MGWVDTGYNLVTGTFNVTGNILAYLAGKTLDAVSESMRIVYNSTTVVTQVAKAAIGQGKAVKLSEEDRKKADKHGDRRVKREMLELLGDFGGIVILEITQAGLVYFANSLSDPDEDEPQSIFWLSAKSTLAFSCVFLSWGVWAISQKKQAEMGVKSIIFVSGANKDLSKLALNSGAQGDQVCVLHQCGIKRDLSHGLYEDLNYFLSRAGLALMGSALPVANKYLISPAGYSNASMALDFTAGPLKWVLGAMLTGRYLINQILDRDGKGLCSKHQLHYLREYYEYGILIGLGVETMTLMLAWSVASCTGINVNLASSVIHSWIFVGASGLIYQTELLPAVNESKRFPLDPFYFTHQGLAILVRNGFPPVKGAIKAILEQEGEPMPILDYLKKCASIAQTPGAELFIHFLLPHMIRGLNRGEFDNLVQDNIVRGRFPGLARKVINYIDKVERFKVNLLEFLGIEMPVIGNLLEVKAITLAQFASDLKQKKPYVKMVMAKLIDKFKMPEREIFLALDIAGSKKVLEQVLAFREELNRLDDLCAFNDDPKVTVTNPMLWLGFGEHSQKLRYSKGLDLSGDISQPIQLWPKASDKVVDVIDSADDDQQQQQTHDTDVRPVNLYGDSDGGINLYQ